MPDDAMKPALRAALRHNEITDDTPYRISFAGKGNSGASFGFMQGDMGAGELVVLSTFTNAMRAAGIAQPAIDSLVRRLSVHLMANPLSPAETDQVNAALVGSSALVDAMDEALLGDVYDGIDTCLSHAQATGRDLQPAAQLYFACWINMTGPPTSVLTWLDGGRPHLHKPIPTAPTSIDGPAARIYLAATDYFSANPRNLPHLDESIAAGMAVLAGPQAASLAARADATSPPLPDDGYVYEQATGRMFQRVGASNDLIATGYSGSDLDNGKNNPDAQCREDIGPLCRGRYDIGQPFNGPSPFSLRLTPDAANEMCGRGGFLIHGDSVAAPGTASHGCIILNKAARAYIDAHRGGPLVVVARM